MRSNFAAVSAMIHSSSVCSLAIDNYRHHNGVDINKFIGDKPSATCPMALTIRRFAVGTTSSLSWLTSHHRRDLGVHFPFRWPVWFIPLCAWLTIGAPVLTAMAEPVCRRENAVAVLLALFPLGQCFMLLLRRITEGLCRCRALLPGLAPRRVLCIASTDPATDLGKPEKGKGSGLLRSVFLGFDMSRL